MLIKPDSISIELAEENRQGTTKIVDALVGGSEIPGMGKQVRDNIETIQDAVISGLHDSLYYPASGCDILRPMVAYDISQITCVDNNRDIIYGLKDQFKKAGIELTLIEETELSTKYSCLINDKPRTINIYFKDARMMSEAEIGKSVDIYHIYLPTGANLPISEKELYLKSKYGEKWYVHEYDDLSIDPEAPKPINQSGEHKIIYPEVSEKINYETLLLVNPGGFIVFGENSLVSLKKATSGLYGLFGLKEMEIVARHPYTITTSLYPDADEIDSMSRKGYIYQKMRHLTKDEFTTLKEVIDLEWEVGYVLMEIGRGGFNYIEGYQEENPTSSETKPTLIENLIAYIENVLSRVNTIKSQMIACGLPQDQVDPFIDAFYQELMNSVKQTQNEIKHFLEEFDKLYEKAVQEQITFEEIPDILGIRMNKYGSYVCPKWPIAIEYIKEFNKDNYEYDRQIRELAATIFEV